MTSKKQKNKVTGGLGEGTAAKFLKDKGYEIVEMNYWRKWGEIDIVAKKDSMVHFVEVKTVSHETKSELKLAIDNRTWRPEEQVHQFKLKQISKALETWVSDNGYDGEWQIDVVAVRVVPRETYASVKYIANIVN